MLLKKIKPYMMPLAMLLGGILYKYVSIISFLTPFLIGVMLFITYCSISFHDIRFSKLHILLLIIQIVGASAIYYLLLPIHPIIAQGAMICVFAPTATSAPVITSMLGGNTASLTSYSLLSNITVAILAPILFSLVGEVSANSFVQSVIIISEKVFLLLLLPFIGAIILRRFFSRVHHVILKSQGLSFYLWTFALVLITGKIVLFITEQDRNGYLVEIMTALCALVICITQFLVGRYLGSKFDDTIAGGQGLGQKNTILAIWMAQTYLNPVSSIGPGSYVLWQNIVNSYQVWRRRKSL